MDSAWDRLLELVEQLATDPSHPLDAEVEEQLSQLAAEAVADHHIDIELHVDDVTRWLTGLVTAHRALRLSHPEVAADTELGNLLRIVTRWLHPARPR
jgi:uncharacterized membrane protein